jgi:hypothetical protein
MIEWTMKLIRLHFFSKSNYILKQQTIFKH